MHDAGDQQGGANRRGSPTTNPDSRTEADPVAAIDLAARDTVLLDGLTALAFPIPTDWRDVYALRQGGSYSFIDRVTGEVISTAPESVWVRLLDLFTLLHTGQGAAPWVAVTGLVALSVPLFCDGGDRQAAPADAETARHGADGGGGCCYCCWIERRHELGICRASGA